jgi:hypothetical protein
MFGHDNQNDDNQYSDSTAPVAPSDDSVSSAPAFDTASISLPPAEEPAPAPAPDPTPAPAPVVTHDEPVSKPADDDHLLSTGGADDLLSIKQNALQQLSPLVGHLEQTPEEKFRTTMMMIQASDDQSLIETAYSAAQAITDDKVRAQALLDIINEINYFTQQHPQD